MLKYLFGIGIIYLVLSIICIILIVKEPKKTNNKEDMTLILISFLVPLIGLIIYAVNVGKDKHITECALKGLKMYLKFLIADIVLSILVILIYFLVYRARINDIAGKIRDNENNEVTETVEEPQMSLGDIERKIANKYNVFITIKEESKTLRLSIIVDDSKTTNDVKEIGDEALKYLYDNYSGYDYQFVVTSSNFSAIGYSSNGKKINWTISKQN